MSRRSPMALTVEQAAAELQVNPETVRRQLSMGRLPGRKVGSTWRLSRRALESYLANPTPRVDATELKVVHGG